MFQNSEFYRSRGPRFPSSLEWRESLLSELVSEAGGEETLRRRAVMWTKGNLPFRHFHLDCVQPEQICCVICVKKGKVFHIHGVLKDVCNSKVLLGKQCF